MRAPHAAPQLEAEELHGEFERGRLVKTAESLVRTSAFPEMMNKAQLPDNVDQISAAAIARFNVTIKTRGDMLPMEFARVLAFKKEQYFDELNKRNTYVQPNCTRWIREEGKGETITRTLGELLAIQ